MAIYLGTYFWELTNGQISFLGLAPLLAVLLAFLTRCRFPSGWESGWAPSSCSRPACSFPSFRFCCALLGVFWANGSPWLVPTLFAFGAISGAMTIGSGILMAAMLADVVEDSELKTKRRSEGLFFAGSSFMAKAVSGFGILASGILLGVVHFPQNAVPGHVDPSIIRNLALVYLPAVMILYGLGITVISRFPIDRAGHEENLRKLAAEAALVPASEHP